MTDIFAVIFGLILTFLTVVVIHELGHLYAGRMVGVRAAVFSIGFGKPIWSRTDRRGVLWQVTRIPAGGYVKFVGDENAASMSSIPDGPVIPGSLRSVSKPAQAFVAVAGPLANVIFTLALLTMLPIISGVTSYPWRIADVANVEAASSLMPGDIVVAIGDVQISPQTTQSAVLARLGTSDSIVYLIERDDLLSRLTAPRPDLPLVGFVAPASPAHTAGILAGDLLLSIDGRDIYSWLDLQDAVTSSAGHRMSVTYARGSQFTSTQINPTLQDGRWIIGVSAVPLFTLRTETPSPSRAAGMGVSQTWDLLARTVTGIVGSVLGQDDSCDLDGPIAIASVAGQAIQLGPETFMLFLAEISLGLGILNLLPVPILDGGHLLLLAVEGITGRPLRKRLQAVLFIGGVTIIIYLMLTATINDLTC